MLSSAGLTLTLPPHQLKPSPLSYSQSISSSASASSASASGSVSASSSDSALPLQLHQHQTHTQSLQQAPHQQQHQHQQQQQQHHRSLHHQHLTAVQAIVQARHHPHAKLRRIPATNLSDYRSHHHQSHRSLTSLAPPSSIGSAGGNALQASPSGGAAGSSSPSTTTALSAAVPASSPPARMSSTMNAAAVSGAGGAGPDSVGIGIGIGGGPHHHQQQQQHHGGHHGSRFDGPRSPPNTSHVPCKFFRQGACQAGNACPFSHDLGAASETVCKYFAKGNCKFGPKCANVHVLPDGRRINYGKNGVTVGATPIAGINLGSRVNPAAYGHHSSNSALTSSFLRAEAVPPYTSYALATDDRYNHGLGRQPSLENGLPTIDATYSGPGSPYGSPRGGDDASSRIGFGLSPATITKGLSVLDAPLPASFDSNGISHAARYGPWPASVPSKFGLESPSSSLSNAKEARTSETLKALHTSAFGSSERLSSSQVATPDASAMGSSPPLTSGANVMDESYFARRAMNSSRYRPSRGGILSASAPKVDRDWEDNFLFLEEDYVPSALANEILTPAEKARRGSLRINEGNESGENSASKYGSPVNASSPSRWGPLFQRQREEEEAAAAGREREISSPLSKSLKGPSVFGHVGSPLRNSSLASGIDAIGQQQQQNGSSSSSKGASLPAASSSASGHQTDSNGGLSVLTQQLQRTRLSGEAGHGSLSSSPRGLHPALATARPATGSTGSTSSPGIIGYPSSRSERDKFLERHVSSGSIGSRFTTPVDEEDPSFVFSMEDDDEAVRKRANGGAGGLAGLVGGGVQSEWTYAGVAAKGASHAHGSGAGAKGAGAAVETR